MVSVGQIFPPSDDQLSLHFDGFPVEAAMLKTVLNGGKTTMRSIVIYLTIKWCL